MTLGSIIERLWDMVDLELIVDECGHVAGVYHDQDSIFNYLNCEVEAIDTTHDGVLVVTVIDDSNNEEQND